MIQERDLTKGAIVKSLWLFALPLMLGNVLQQFYNLVDNMGGWALSWQKGTGGSWRIVYVDDIFDFGCYWSVSGSRCLFFDGIR